MLDRSPLVQHVLGVSHATSRVRDSLSRSRSPPCLSSSLASLPLCHYLAFASLSLAYLLPLSRLSPPLSSLSSLLPLSMPSGFLQRLPQVTDRDGPLRERRPTKTRAQDGLEAGRRARGSPG